MDNTAHTEESEHTPEDRAFFSLLEELARAGGTALLTRREAAHELDCTEELLRLYERDEIFSPDIATRSGKRRLYSLEAVLQFKQLRGKRLHRARVQDELNSQPQAVVAGINQ